MKNSPKINEKFAESYRKLHGNLLKIFNENFLEI